MPELNQEKTLTFRLLSGADAANYRTLRLQALEHDGAAYVTTFDLESTKHTEEFAAELEAAFHPPWFGYHGCFAGDQLVGYCHVAQMLSEKQRHCAELLNLFVHPNHRGQGLSTQFVSKTFEAVASHEHIERIFLTCLESNTHAQHFYDKLGFVICGRKPRSIKWQGQYDSEIIRVKELR